MRIGLLHYSMPPAVGGVERVLAAHARLFRTDGHEVVLLCGGSQPNRDQEFPCVTVPGFSNDGDPRENCAKFMRFIQEQSLEILFVHNVLTMPFSEGATMACSELAASDLPVVSWVHDLAAINPYYQVPENAIIRRHPPGSTVVAVSEERAAAYRELTGFESVQVVPNGIDLFLELAGDLLKTRPALKGTLAGAFPILFHPTRILRRKNIGLGLRVVAELKKLGFTPRLLISGAQESFSGEQAAYQGELDNLVSDLCLEGSVFFLADESPLEATSMGQLYQLADALFFPSEQEGFGLPVLEAGIRKTPIFASETQPLAHLARENGVVFPLAASPVELAIQIRDFFSLCSSSQVRRAIQRDFDWQGIYDNHILPLLNRLT
jgi:glycosyltransferase involved in cell wall biosynthesis